MNEGTLAGDGLAYRLGVLRVDPNRILEMVKGGHQPPFCVTENPVPDDAKVLRVGVDPIRLDCLVLVLESEEFDPTYHGCSIPNLPSPVLTHFVPFVKGEMPLNHPTHRAVISAIAWPGARQVKVEAEPVSRNTGWRVTVSAERGGTKTIWERCPWPAPGAREAWIACAPSEVPSDIVDLIKAAVSASTADLVMSQSLI